MTYSKYISALLFICFGLFGSSAFAQAYMIVGSGAKVQVSCGTRVMVNSTALKNSSNSTTTADTLALGHIYVSATTNDSVGKGSIILAANCASGFRQVENTSLSTWEVSLYPNPAANELFIDTKGFSGTTEFALLDISGKVVLTQSWEASENEVRSLTLQSLSSGLYLYRIINGAHHVSGKLVKE